ncbi:MAG: tetratricopeptide repeat-containing sensor histidine kinase [Bacteroidetes bacterium]|nr:tetratricopeptide repeat-containing sensor histidine kinase [Bacteroidota bacterium]MBU1115040.1 tetratricopeptide repeat-containing sensor histidine kinase [Bacteroidota bacterium]MBU1799532.1 tetratricopeptide repeat-containing sensor histidine kinase [Bacteroidota bacterium]
MKHKILVKSIIIWSIFITILSDKIVLATVDPQTNQNPKNEVNKFLDSCWYYRTSNPLLALDFGNKALNLIEENEYTELKPKTLNFLGVVQRKLGDLSKSYDYFMKALNLANELKDSAQIGYTYNNLADYYLKKASYSIALENVLISYQIFKNLNHKIGMAYSLNYLGEIYIHHGDYNKALKYLEEASALRLEIDDKRGYSNSLVNIGLIHFKQNNYELARDYYKKAIKINNAIKYKKGRSTILSLYGDIYFAIKNYKIAVNSFKAALKFAKSANDKAGVIENSNKLGLVYLKLGKFSDAKNLFEDALNSANESGHLDQEMLSYLYLSQYNAEIKQFEASLKYLNKYIILKDSIYSNENMGRFADLQTLFETQNKEMENKILKKEVSFEKTTNNYLLIISLVVIILILVLISKYKAQNKTNNLLKELNDSKDKFFSILAHDLKNPFQALMGYTDMLNDDFDEFSNEEIKNSINSLQKISHNVYELLEGVLEWSRAQTGRMEFNPTLFKLSEESNSVIQLYSQNAINKGISLTSNVNESIIIFSDRNMIKTIIRNLVSNGLKFTDNGGYVKIFAEKTKHDIKVIVEDSGIGMNQNVVDNLFKIDIHHTTTGTEGEVGTGVGLMLCHELVKHHNGKIWAESQLGVGSKFIFTLPIEK